MPTPRALAAAAAGSWAANCVLGAAVQAGVLDTSRNRWAHHALYVATSALTAVAIAGAFAQGSRRGFALVPTLLPLAVLPHVGHDAHAVTGLAAGPWYAAAVLLPGWE